MLRLKAALSAVGALLVGCASSKPAEYRFPETSALARGQAQTPPSAQKDPVLRIRVVDESGMAMQATLAIDWSRGMGCSDVQVWGLEGGGPTSPDGRADIWGIPPGPVLVRAWSTTRATELTRVDVLDGVTREVTLVAHPTFSVRGAVRRKDGRGVDAMLALLRAEGAQSAPSF
jgi:hypothetical protein